MITSLRGCSLQSRDGISVQAQVNSVELWVPFNTHSRTQIQRWTLEAASLRCGSAKLQSTRPRRARATPSQFPSTGARGRATRGSAVLVGEHSRRRCLDALGAPKFGLASSMFRRNPTFDSTVHPSGRCRSDEGADNTPVDRGLRSGSFLVTDDWAQWGKNPTDLRIFRESDERSSCRRTFCERVKNERWSSQGLDHRWGSILQSRTD